MTLNAEVFMHFPRGDAEGFYSKLRKGEVLTTGEQTELVPTIDANNAQASVESDRVRIFKEITDSIGLEQFNSQLQEYLERSMRAAATEALLERGGVGSYEKQPSHIGKPNSGASAEAHGNDSTTKAKKKNAVMPRWTLRWSRSSWLVVEDEPRRRDKRQAFIG